VSGWQLAGAGRAEKVDTVLALELKARGLLAETATGDLAISPDGRAFVRRRLAGNEGFAAQHQERAFLADGFGEGPAGPIAVNLGESPLSLLRRRKGSDCRPAIDAAEFAAGERLRADYERARLMPRVTADWSAIARNRPDGTGRGRADLTDAALDARRRVEAALKAVGPDFAGVLVDFCCFLVGIEELERTRRWPARSAKVIVRLALASLARHYGLSAAAEGPISARTRHWGAADYRPTIE
jgi:hypothetical protein